MVLLETRDRLYDSRQVALSNGIAEVRPQVPFLVRVTNFSTKFQELVNNQIVGYANEAPETILEVHLDDDLPTDASRTPATEKK